nr:MAG TPA: hypothetical protein [Caudoviricetes sp.]
MAFEYAKVYTKLIAQRYPQCNTCTRSVIIGRLKGRRQKGST